MLASTTPPSRKQPVEVISETPQDYEVLVICSHTDQLVPAPLAAFQLQHQQAMEEATSSADEASRLKRKRMGSASSPTRLLLSMGLEEAASIRPKDIDGPNVCAPVTQFDEERFRHFIQQMLTVNRHYFETNRTPRGAQRDRLTSSNRKRHVAVLTDHMTQAQRETLALEVRTRIAAAAPHDDKRVLEMSFFTKNPNANARGREYLRASVPNTVDIQHVTSIQNDYIAKCANPYNYSKAELLMGEGEAVRIEKGLDRYAAAMSGLGQIGAYEVRSNVGIMGNSTISGGGGGVGVGGMSPRRSTNNSPRRPSQSTLGAAVAAKRSSNANGGMASWGSDPSASHAGGASTSEKNGSASANAAPPAAQSRQSRNNHNNGGDDTSDSDDDFSVAPNIANDPAFIKAINGGIGARRQQRGVANQLSNARGNAHGDGNFNVNTREGYFAALNLGGAPVVYPEGKVIKPAVSNYGFNGGSGGANGLNSLGSTLSNTNGGGLGGGGTTAMNSNSDVFDATTDLQQKLNKATTLHAKEVAKASIALVAEDMRKRGIVGAGDGPSSNRFSGTANSARSAAMMGSTNGGGGGSFLPTLVDPNAAVVMGEISAFTKGRFDKRTGAYNGAFSSGAQSMFAGSDGADHSASARRRSQFQTSGGGIGAMMGMSPTSAGRPRAALHSPDTAASNGDPSVEGGGKRGGAGGGKGKEGDSATAKKDGGGSGPTNPRHAKFLISRTPFSSGGSVAGMGGGGGSSSSHTSSILTNAYLFNALFEQLNGVNSLSTNNNSTNGSSGNGPVNGTGSAPVVGVKQTVCVLSNPAYPVKSHTKKAVLHRLLDVYGESVMGATLKSAEMLAALIEANSAGANGGAQSSVVVGGASGSALNNLNTMIVDMSLQDYLLMLLTPEPIPMTRAVPASHGNGSAAPMLRTFGNTTTALSTSLSGHHGTDGALTTTIGSGSNGGASPRSWLRPDAPPDTLSSTELRLSPRKAVALSDRIATFAANPPSSPIASRVGVEVTTMSITSTGAYKFRTTSPRSAKAPAQLTPIQQHLHDTIKKGEAEMEANGGVATLGGEVIATSASSSSNTKKIPSPPNATIPKPPSGTVQVRKLDLLPLAAGIDGTLTDKNSNSSSGSLLRIPYSSSYHDTLLSNIMARSGATESGGSGGGGYSTGAQPRRSVTIDDGGFSTTATSRSNNGPNRNGQYAAEVIAVVRPFDQFFKVFDPELSGHVRRDTFILALCAGTAALTDVSGKSKHDSAAAAELNNHRRDAKSSIYYAAMWIVCVLLQQPATSEDIKLGELFALRDCLKQVVLREQRLEATDKAVRRLNNTLKLLTPRSAEDDNKKAKSKSVSKPSTPRSATDGSANASFAGVAGGVMTTVATPTTTTLSNGVLASGGDDAKPSSSASPAAVPNVLACLEDAAAVGIETHSLVSYGELAMALVEALDEDGY